MAFQTSVLRDGEWVTETVDVGAALRVSSVSKETPEYFPERPPCGILSSTIIESPVVHKVLPARIRSKDYNDIAFIGDHFVSISELGDNGQHQEILRHETFGSRIRNAVVIGTCPDGSLGEDDDATAVDGRAERLDSSCKGPNTSSGAETPHPLPPQLLILIFESGEMALLFIKQNPDGLELCASTYASLESVPFLGYRLVVDPSSRYMAVGSFEDILAVYELQSWATLNEEYIVTGSLPRPFKSVHIRSLRGTIHDVQFLYPRPQDDYHIILAVMLSSKSRNAEVPSSRKYITWDWEAGDNLKEAFSRSCHKQKLPHFQEFPLFLIPLKPQNAFFIVYEEHIAVVKQSLSSAEYDFTFLDIPKPSKYHHGSHRPLWTSWARPFRREEYFEKTDIIYLAREDGFVFHIEIDSATLLYSAMDIGCLGTTISTAFTTAYDRFSDLLIIGGDAGPGGIWKLAARSELEQVGTFANWSPVVDIATTDENVSWDSVDPGGRNGLLPQAPRRPDRIFFASGRGITGSLVEPRIGMKARIGIDLDIGEPVKQAWLFTDERLNDGSMYAILALPHSTAVLHFSNGFGDVTAESSETTQFDTSSRTLHAARTSPGIVVQISERFVTLATISQSAQHLLGDALQIPDATAEKAFCFENLILVSVQSTNESKLFVLRIEQMDISLESSRHVQGEISCLSLFRLSNKQYMVVASILEQEPMLSVYSTDGSLVVSRHLNGRVGDSDSTLGSLETLTSICIVQETENAVDVVGGTRCGHLLTIRISHNELEPITLAAQKLGFAPVDVFPASDLFNEPGSAFATCDQGLIRLSGLSHSQHRYKQKDSVWPMDMSNPSLPAPPVHSVFTIRSTMENADSKPLLLLLGGTRLYLADIEPRIGPIPRSIPVGGTPTKVMYSHVWKCLVVALLKDNRSTLVFIDPDTGETVSQATDKDRKECDNISGLGQGGDRILGLYEWLYVKDGQAFPFIIVTTQAASLLIVSVREAEHGAAERRGKRLEYWTRYRKKSFKEPIYSVVPDDEGLVFCVGKTLHWHVLDLGARKLKPVKEYELDSPATSLDVVDGKVFALTSMHSMEVIDYKSKPESAEMTLLHTDQVSRAAVHMIKMGHVVDKSLWPVTLISDVAGGIAGVWVPWDQRDKELVTVFEAKLRSSVRRFARARCQPTRWQEDQGQSRFGSLPSTTDGAEILGVSLDGTLRHFKLLGLELWRLLSLIQSLAERHKMTNLVGLSKRTNGCDEPLGTEPEPSTMHINGNTLRRCLTQRHLEALVGEGGCLSLFCEYLDDLEGGSYTNAFRQNGETGVELQSKYFELGYDILEYLLAPVV